jgi:hypothetical protein
MYRSWFEEGISYSGAGLDGCWLADRLVFLDVVDGGRQI